MRYVSTRGGCEPMSFEQALLAGWAPDGGMLLPETIPKLTSVQLAEWRQLSYKDLCFEVLRLFISPAEVPDADLRTILGKSLDKFNIPDIVRLKELGDFNVLELWHGPTLAFKDLGMTVLVALLNHFLEKRNSTLNLIVGTSGDTGPSAMAAVQGCSHLTITCLYPKGHVSPAQELQMMSLSQEPNMRLVAVEGTSDDLDRPIEEVFGDTKFREGVSLGSVNSVNVGRVLVQIVHFIYASARLVPTRFFVPTGAAGHITAGVMAVLMGCPITEICACVNENDLLHRSLSSPADAKNLCTPVLHTNSPAMDIQVPYNLERLAFFGCNGDSKKVIAVMEGLKRSGEVVLPQECLAFLRGPGHLTSATFTSQEVSAVIKSVWERNRYLIDPHTAVSVVAVLQSPVGPERPESRVCMGCAHPLKFQGTVVSAVGEEASFPAECTAEWQQYDSLRKMLELLETPRYGAGVDTSESNFDPSLAVKLFKVDLRETWASSLKDIVCELVHRTS